LIVLDNDFFVNKVEYLAHEGEAGVFRYQAVGNGDLVDLGVDSNEFLG